METEFEQWWKRKWDCSQDEGTLEEGDIMDWYEDDEMRRQLEETSKEEEKIARRKMEGKGLQVEGAQSVPELSGLSNIE